MTDLKPCPFCGSSNVENWASRPRDAAQDVWCVFCHSCNCEGPEAKTEAEAAASWNSRLAGSVATLLASPHVPIIRAGGAPLSVEIITQALEVFRLMPDFAPRKFSAADFHIRASPVQEQALLRFDVQRMTIDRSVFQVLAGPEEFLGQLWEIDLNTCPDELCIVALNRRLWVRELSVSGLPLRGLIYEPPRRDTPPYQGDRSTLTNEQT
jgi:Lar family restriction alleviation protein